MACVPRSVVCIARSTGAGGEEVGRLVADRLGFLYVDEEVISRAAALGGVAPETVAGEEQRKRMFAGLFEHLADAGTATMLTGAHVPADGPSSEAVRSFIRDAVHEVAARGKVVIVAHAASYAVGGDPAALRVLVTASRETRARRLAAAEGSSDADAAKEIKRDDAGRVDYLKRFYGVGEELPVHYDLVINTDTLSTGQAAELIVQAAAGPAAA